MPGMRNPRSHFAPLAIGAPDPIREIPVTPSRMIHFFDPSNEKLRRPGCRRWPRRPTSCWATSRTRSRPTRKEAARAGWLRPDVRIDLGATPLWTRMNALESPWVLDDLVTLVTEIGSRLDVVMVPKVEGPWDIHYVDRLLAQLEAARVSAPDPRPRDPGDRAGRGQRRGDRQRLAADAGDLPRSGRPRRSRRMKTTRVGGGHPGYRVLADPRRRIASRRYQQDLWHYTIGRMVDACAAAGIFPSTGRSATSRTSRAARPSSAPPT